MSRGTHVRFCESIEGKFLFATRLMFSLTRKEIMDLSQSVISSRIKHAPNVFAFTENGVAMLSSVLNSRRAVQVNIQIMRAFTRLRLYLSTHKQLAEKLKELAVHISGQDDKIQAIIEVINRLLRRPSIEVPKPRFRISGFKKS